MIDRAVVSELTVQQMGGEPASNLFYHAVAVGLALAILIASFARTSGAHFTPPSLWPCGGADPLGAKPRSRFSSSSTGLLNLAVTFARVFTDTCTGIPAATAPVFISAQLLGALTAVYIPTRLLIRPNGKEHDADHAYDR